MEGRQVMDVNFNDVVVANNEAEQRFEVKVAGQIAVAEYKRSGTNIIFTHTEVPPAFEGHGVASKIAHTALDHARAEKLTVVPLCPFIASYIRRHTEYRSLVHPDFQDLVTRD